MNYFCRILWRSGRSQFDELVQIESFVQHSVSFANFLLLFEIFRLVIAWMSGFVPYSFTIGKLFAKISRIVCNLLQSVKNFIYGSGRYSFWNWKEEVALRLRKILSWLGTIMHWIVGKWYERDLRNFVRKIVIMGMISATNFRQGCWIIEMQRFLSEKPSIHSKRTCSTLRNKTTRNSRSLMQRIILAGISVWWHTAGKIKKKGKWFRSPWAIHRVKICSKCFGQELCTIAAYFPNFLPSDYIFWLFRSMQL